MRQGNNETEAARKTLKDVLASDADRLERRIRTALTTENGTPGDLYDMMRYATLGGGKRIRGFLVLSFCRLFGGAEEAALDYGAALEMIHAFSLVHDDLPCMDNDDTRRGKPSTHKQYGEAPALIAGDALMFAAFRCASGAAAPAQSNLAACRLLAERAGAEGMCGGQMMDMEAEGKRVPLSYLEELQNLKTGALIRCAAELGCIAAGVSPADRRYTDAVAYADAVGRAFQIQDDILDVEGDETLLGKPVGSDAANEKSTFVSELGLAGAKKELLRLTEEAVGRMASYDGAETLSLLARMLSERRN